MRTATCMLGILLTTGTITHAQAAEPSQLKQRECGIVIAPSTSAIRCAPAKASAEAGQVSKAGLHYAVCERLTTRIERDTCLNRVEATS